MSAPLDSVARLARLKITDPIVTLEAIDKLLDRYDPETSASGTIIDRLERLIKVGNAPLDGSDTATGDCGCEHDDFECYAEQCLNAAGLDVEDIDSIEALLDRFDPLPSSSGTMLERLERLLNVRQRHEQATQRLEKMIHEQMQCAIRWENERKAREQA